MKKMIALGLILGLLLIGCTPKVSSENAALQPAEQQDITTARELEEFFVSGGSFARLNADIDMEDTMLKLTAERGSVKIIGNGHTIAGSAPCVIRMEDGCSIAFTGLSISAKQTGLGLLGSGTVAAEETAINAQLNAIQAAGAVTVASASSLSLSGEEGSGILALGFALGEDSLLTVSAATAAINTGRGNITLYPRAKAVLEAAGDNTLKTDGSLVLMEETVLEAANTGEHNGARIGALQADASATINAKGGVNGVGLFVVELFEDMTLKGFSEPDLKIEVGKGKLTFEE